MPRARFPTRRGSRPDPRPKYQATRLPAPQGGFDGRISPAAGDPLTCPYTYNLIPDELGLQLRSGYREYVTNVNAGSSLGVNTLIPFNAADAADDRLFAVNNEGIWDVTTDGDTAPPQVFTFGATGGTAGYGPYLVVTDDAGEEYIFYADSDNGLLRYVRSTATWAAPTITFPDSTLVGDINFVTKHKLRIWLVRKNSGLAYYLGPDAVQGAATLFDFGSKFRRGGTITGIYTWTLDGGDGVDDYVVIVGSQGDVLVYRGTDPSSAQTWALVGNYFIGEVPPAVRAGYQYAGELYLLSAYGLSAMSDLLRGTDPAAPMPNTAGYKIAKALQADMRSTLDRPEWSMLYVPFDEHLIVLPPQRENTEFVQYVQNVTQRGWGFWRGVPARCIEVFRGVVYFAGEHNSVFAMQGTRDAVTLAAPPPGTVNGEPVEFSVLFNPSTLEAPGVYKRVTTARPDFLASEAPSFQTKILYDYAQREFTAPSLPDPAVATGVWDTSEWDSAVWGSGEISPSSATRVTSGLGRTAAFAIRGRATAELALVSVDIIWNRGGPL